MLNFFVYLFYKLGLYPTITPKYVGVYNNKKTGIASIVYVTPEGFEVLKQKYGLTGNAAIRFECKRTNNGEYVSVIPTKSLPKNHDNRDNWIVDHVMKRIVITGENK